jgi:hypothetical protein
MDSRSQLPGDETITQKEEPEDPSDSTLSIRDDGNESTISSWSEEQNHAKLKMGDIPVGDVVLNTLYEALSSFVKNETIHPSGERANVFGQMDSLTMRKNHRDGSPLRTDDAEKFHDIFTVCMVAMDEAMGKIMHDHTMSTAQIVKKNEDYSRVINPFEQSAIILGRNVLEMYRDIPFLIENIPDGHEGEQQDVAEFLFITKKLLQYLELGTLIPHNRELVVATLSLTLLVLFEASQNEYLSSDDERFGILVRYFYSTGDTGIGCLLEASGKGFLPDNFFVNNENHSEAYNAVLLLFISVFDRWKRLSHKREQGVMIHTDSSFEGQYHREHGMHGVGMAKRGKRGIRRNSHSVHRLSHQRVLFHYRPLAGIERVVTQ